MEEALLLVIISLSGRFNFTLALALVILVATRLVFMSYFVCSGCDSFTPSSSSNLETDSYSYCKSDISSSDSTSLSSLLVDVYDVSLCCDFVVNSILSGEKRSMYSSTRYVLS